MAVLALAGLLVSSDYFSEPKFLMTQAVFYSLIKFLLKWYFSLILLLIAAVYLFSKNKIRYLVFGFMSAYIILCVFWAVYFIFFFKLQLP